MRESVGTSFGGLAANSSGVLGFVVAVAVTVPRQCRQGHSTLPHSVASCCAFASPITARIFSSASARAAAVSPSVLPAFASFSLAVSVRASSLSFVICSSVNDRRDLRRPGKDSSAKNASSTGKVSGCDLAALSLVGDGVATAGGEDEPGAFWLDSIRRFGYTANCSQTTCNRKQMIWRYFMDVAPLRRYQPALIQN